MERVGASSATRRRPFRNFHFRRWLGLLATVGALLVFAWVDGRLKTPGIVGYYPAGAVWLAASRDLPDFWARAEDSAQMKDMPPEARWLLHDLVLSAHEKLGVRPTPRRLDLWLGPYAVITHGPEGTGACFRPGLLMRWGHFARPPEEVFVWKDYYLAWRNGYLVVSASRDYVASALRPDAPVFRTSGTPKDLLVRGSKPWEFSVTVAAREGFPVTGWVNRAITPAEGGVTFDGSWPEDSVIRIAAASGEDALGLARESLWFLDDERLVDPAWRALDEALPKEWSSKANETLLVLTGLDTAQFLVTPELLWVYRGFETEAAAPEGAIPQEWRGRPGWIAPWLGPKMMICAAQWGEDRYVTTREPTMAAHFGSARESRTAADLVVSVDWEQAIKGAAALTQRAAEAELIGWNAEEVRTYWWPLFEWAARWGELRVEGNADAGRVTFGGLLSITEAAES